MKVKQRKRSQSRIRKGDNVIVVSGKEKGNTGKVLSVDWKNERILVAEHTYRIGFSAEISIHFHSAFGA